MAQSRAQMQKELVPGLHAIFGTEYAQYPDQWKDFYQIDKSERSFEEELKLAGFGMAAVKQEGMGIDYDVGSQEGPVYRYTHEVIALGFAITEEAIEDNLYDSLSKRYSAMLARSFKYTKNYKGAVPFNTGFTTYTVGDGQTLFSTAHPLISGGTNSNRGTTHADLNETSLEAACQTIWNWTDERGLLIQAKPVSLHVPPGNVFNAERVTKTVLKQGTANNDINATYSMSIIPNGYKVNNYLTDSAAWFIKTDIPNGAKHFVRVALKMDNLGDFDTGNFRFKGRERYSFGFSDVLKYYGVSGT